MPTKAAAPQDGTPFKDFLLNSIQEVNSMQKDADTAVEKLATGGNVSPVEVLTAVQKADIAFNLMMQVRNKTGASVRGRAEHARVTRTCNSCR